MSTQEHRDRLETAIAALEKGDRTFAENLIQEELAHNPQNLAAWNWACQIATGQEEKAHCLEQILTINPADEDARRLLGRLRKESGASETAQPEPASTKQMRSRRSNSLVGWIASGAQLGVIVLALVFIAALIYSLPKSGFLGLRGPDFDSLTVSDSYQQIESDDFYWKIIFEKAEDSTFQGTVRHNSPIRINRFRILTHDTLVTFGEFSDPTIVDTSVSNHRFRWYSEQTTQPKGTINLLHTVPASEEVFQQLRTIQAGDPVIITGREVQRIQVYDLDGEYLGDWHDQGCNTILVSSVIIQE